MDYSPRLSKISTKFRRHITMNSIYNYKMQWKKKRLEWLSHHENKTLLLTNKYKGMLIHFQQLLIITKYEASLLLTTITKRYKSFYERKSMMVEIITHRSSVQNLTHIFQRKNQERGYNDIYYYWFLLCRGRFMQSKQFNHPNDVPNAQIEEN